MSAREAAVRPRTFQIEPITPRAGAFSVMLCARIRRPNVDDDHGVAEFDDFIRSVFDARRTPASGPLSNSAFNSSVPADGDNGARTEPGQNVPQAKPQLC